MALLPKKNDRRRTPIGLHRLLFQVSPCAANDSRKRGRYHKFLNAVEKAQAESESRDVAIIAKAASDDWKAAAWRLERKQPRRYGPRVAVSVQQELDAVLDRLKKGLPPEWYEKVLELMAADVEAPDTGNGQDPSQV